MKKCVFSLIVLFVIAANLPAVTILQTWDTDTWTYQVGGSSGSAYSALPGWLYAQTRAKKGDLTVVAETFAPLGANAIAAGTSVTAIPEFWMQADYQYLSGSTAYNAYIGLQYSQGTNLASSGSPDVATRELIGFQMSGTIVGAYSLANNGTTGLLTAGSLTAITPTLGGLDVTGTYRVKMHFYQSGGNLNADYALYLIDSVDFHLTQQGATVSGIVASGTNNFVSGLDMFGLRNAYRSTSITASPMTHNFDNLYFSTDGAYTGSAVPEWIPEPATVIILGLGGLLLRRRK